MSKPSIAVHKFSSCDGCQLAFLNLGEPLLALAELVNISHFAEAGILDEETQVDIAFVEGSIATKKDESRIQTIRDNTKYLITMGACATSGGIQALKNTQDSQDWTGAIYASPQYIDTLETVSPISNYIHVDFELWGCPVSSEQIVTTVRSLLSGVTPKDNSEKVCMQCKRKQNICTMVTQDEPCLGPVTKAGCGAICPEFGRACYACYGPAVDTNTSSLSNRFIGLGLNKTAVSNKFQFINNNAAVFRNAATRILG